MTAGRKSISNNKNWCTPPKYIKPIRDFFDSKISLDPCSNEYSITNAEVEYKLPEHDGLNESWNFPKIFVNPPYGRDKERRTTIKDWLYKCANAFESYGSEVIALIPVATNTRHWKQYVFGKASCICFLYDTRLKFMVDGSIENKGAPMACCLVYWGKNIQKFKQYFEEYGFIVILSK